MKTIAFTPLSLLFGAMLASCGGGGGGSANPDATASDAPSVPAPVAGANTANMFFSGHSLTDNPLPEHVASIAASLNKQTLWNQQNIVGSPIRVRTRGDSYSDPGFGGYQRGKNRDGENMNVAAELRNPQTLNGQRYDALVLTERHDLPLDGDEAGVRYARHLHERLIEGNAQAATYLYHAWQNVESKSNPASWLAFERAAAPVWQCVASRINTSLAGEGRSDRMHYLPSGLALIELVDRATRGQVDGVSAGSTLETMNRIFSDQVHLTPMGVYYMALVTYASVYRGSPQGAWAPAGVTAAQAKSLQDLAWTVTANYYANPSNQDPATCAAYMRNDFCQRIYTYINVPQAIGECQSNYGASNGSNPFYYNAASDRSYWAPAP